MQSETETQEKTMNWNFDDVMFEMGDWFWSILTIIWST
jgi:hypothetical protein